MMNATETTKATINELLNIAPHAGKVLHTIYRVDFLKPFICGKISGNFTIKKINDFVKSAGFKNAEILLLMTDSEGYRKNWLQLVEISENDFNIEPTKKLWQAGAHDNISTYCRKADFNEQRKSKNAITYIIAQDKSDLTPEKVETVDRGARFKYLKHETHTARDGKKYITRVFTRRTDDNGSNYTVNNHGQYVYTSMLEKYCELSEIIDKSGYITQDKRDNLLREAKRLRAEREKAEYLKTDHTDKICKIKKEIEETRDRLAEKLKQARTYDEITAISNKIDRYNGLRGAFSQFAIMTERINAGNFSSNRQIENMLTDIRGFLANCI